MLGTGLVLLGLNANWPELVEGLIIIFVVSIGIGINNRVAKARGVPRFFRALGVREEPATQKGRSLAGFNREGGPGELVKARSPNERNGPEHGPCSRSKEPQNKTKKEMK